MKYKSATTNYLLLGLIGFSIFALAFGYFHIRHQIRSPFAVSRPKRQATDIQKLLAEIQQRDTDQDGLSDFDETYKYKTSIYIPDTDSDNFSDKEEVEAGSNPLNSESNPYNKKVVESNLEEQSFQSALKKGAEELGQPSAQEIRDFLVNRGGLSKETVDKIDDKTLLELYNETKAETGLNLEQIKQLEESGQAQFEQNLPSEKDLFLQGLEKMTPQEIRQALISSGIDEKLLEKVDDQTLKSIFSKAIKQQMK